MTGGFETAWKNLQCWSIPIQIWDRVVSHFPRLQKTWMQIVLQYKWPDYLIMYLRILSKFRDRDVSRDLWALRQTSPIRLLLIRKLSVIRLWLWRAGRGKGRGVVRWFFCPPVSVWKSLPSQPQSLEVIPSITLFPLSPFKIQPCIYLKLMPFPPEEPPNPWNSGLLSTDVNQKET